jgi:hypothetical protein
MAPPAPHFAQPRLHPSIERYKINAIPSVCCELRIFEDIPGNFVILALGLQSQE